MGVPVTEDIVCRAQRPSVDDTFPYLFDGTTIEDYNQAKFNSLANSDWLPENCFRSMFPTISRNFGEQANSSSLFCLCCFPNSF